MFLGRGHIAKGPSGSCFRLCGSHTFALEPCHFQRQMCLDLVIKVTLLPLAPKHDSPLHFTGAENTSDGRRQAPPLTGFMD